MYQGGNSKLEKHLLDAVYNINEATTAIAATNHLGSTKINLQKDLLAAVYKTLNSLQAYMLKNPEKKIEDKEYFLVAFTEFSANFVVDLPQNYTPGENPNQKKIDSIRNSLSKIETAFKGVLSSPQLHRENSSFYATQTSKYVIN